MPNNSIEGLFMLKKIYIICYLCMIASQQLSALSVQMLDFIGTSVILDITPAENANRLRTFAPEITSLRDITFLSREIEQNLSQLEESSFVSYEQFIKIDDAGDEDLSRQVAQLVTLLASSLQADTTAIEDAVDVAGAGASSPIQQVTPSMFALVAAKVRKVIDKAKVDSSGADEVDSASSVAGAPGASESLKLEPAGVAGAGASIAGDSRQSGTGQGSSVSSDSGESAAGTAIRTGAAGITSGSQRPTGSSLPATTLLQSTPQSDVDSMLFEEKSGGYGLQRYPYGFLDDRLQAGSSQFRVSSMLAGSSSLSTTQRQLVSEDQGFEGNDCGFRSLLLNFPAIEGEVTSGRHCSMARSRGSAIFAARMLTDPWLRQQILSFYEADILDPKTTAETQHLRLLSAQNLTDFKQKWAFFRQSTLLKYQGFDSYSEIPTLPSRQVGASSPEGLEDIMSRITYSVLQEAFVEAGEFRQFVGGFYDDFHQQLTGVVERFSSGPTDYLQWLAEDQQLVIFSDSVDLQEAITQTSLSSGRKAKMFATIRRFVLHKIGYLLSTIISDIQDPSLSSTEPTVILRDITAGLNATTRQTTLTKLKEYFGSIGDGANLQKFLKGVIDGYTTTIEYAIEQHYRAQKQQLLKVMIYSLARQRFLRQVYDSVDTAAYKKFVFRFLKYPARDVMNLRVTTPIASLVSVAGGSSSNTTTAGMAINNLPISFSKTVMAKLGIERHVRYLSPDADKTREVEVDPIHREDGPYLAYALGMNLMAVLDDNVGPKVRDRYAHWYFFDKSFETFYNYHSGFHYQFLFPQSQSSTAQKEAYKQKWHNRNKQLYLWAVRTLDAQIGSDLGGESESGQLRADLVTGLLQITPGVVRVAKDRSDAPSFVSARLSASASLQSGAASSPQDASSSTRILYDDTQDLLTMGWTSQAANPVFRSISFDDYHSQFVIDHTLDIPSGDKRVFYTTRPRLPVFHAYDLSPASIQSRLWLSLGVGRSSVIANLPQQIKTLSLDIPQEVGSASVTGQLSQLAANIHVNVVVQVLPSYDTGSDLQYGVPDAMKLKPHYWFHTPLPEADDKKTRYRGRVIAADSSQSSGYGSIIQASGDVAYSHGNTLSGNIGNTGINTQGKSTHLFSVIDQVSNTGPGGTRTEVLGTAAVTLHVLLNEDDLDKFSQLVRQVADLGSIFSFLPTLDSSDQLSTEGSAAIEAMRQLVTITLAAS